MPSTSVRSAVSLGAVLLALLAIVALASHGHVSSGSGSQTRHLNSDIVLEYALLIFGLLALIATLVVSVEIWKSRGDPTILPARGNWMRSLFGMMTFLALISVAIVSYHLFHRSGSTKTSGTPHLVLPKGLAGRKGGHPAKPELAFDWVPVIVVLSIALAGAAVGAFFFLRRGRPGVPLEEQAAAALRSALDESLDDLRAERDARRAVIAAYARMERALAACGVPRRPAEAPLEYLARILHDLLRASAASVSRLTALFERAKFSQHEIGPDLKDEAIGALVAIREELQASS